MLDGREGSVEDQLLHAVVADPTVVAVELVDEELRSVVQPRHIAYSEYADLAHPLALTDPVLPRPVDLERKQRPDGSSCCEDLLLRVTCRLTEQSVQGSCSSYKSAWSPITMLYCQRRFAGTSLPSLLRPSSAQYTFYGFLTALNIRPDFSKCTAELRTQGIINQLY